jgi:hypothetical protein
VPTSTSPSSNRSNLPLASRAEEFGTAPIPHNRDRRAHRHSLYAGRRQARSIATYGLAPNDPTTITGAAVVFIVTGFVAALVPAFRASTIDPMDALRQE